MKKVDQRSIHDALDRAFNRPWAGPSVRVWTEISSAVLGTQVNRLLPLEAHVKAVASPQEKHKAARCPHIEIFVSDDSEEVEVLSKQNFNN